MSLNAWLCKHFDDDNKGYVTIRDVLYTIVEWIATPIIYNFELLLCIFAIFVIVGATSAGIQGFLVEPMSATSLIYAILKGWIIPLIISISLYLLYQLSSIKIAKCQLKK